jgi:hypothetical protein
MMTFSTMSLNAYAEYCYDKCLFYAVGRNYVIYVERHYAECHYAECHYAECHYAECHYDECRTAHEPFYNTFLSSFYPYFQKTKKCKQYFLKIRM